MGVSNLRSQSTTLLAFESIQGLIAGQKQLDAGTQMIDLKRIKGSVGHAYEFDRDFVPQPHADRQRWQHVYDAYAADIALPPIEVFEVGTVYYVRDGHYRVSVARCLGHTQIAAHVIAISLPMALVGRSAY